MSKKSRILIVDDNEQNLELLQVYVESMPEVEVATARNGVEAIEEVQSEAPDLILLDIMMPKMSGFEVCKRLKNDRTTAEIPIVMVTALNETGDVERAAECGADEYVTKPIERSALVELIRGLLKTRPAR